MTASSWAGIVGAAAGLVTAGAAVIGVLPALVRVLRETRRNTKAVNEVHTIVNQQRTDTLNYQRALIEALRKSGVEVPADQSIPPTTYSVDE